MECRRDVHRNSTDDAVPLMAKAADSFSNMAKLPVATFDIETVVSEKEALRAAEDELEYERAMQRVSRVLLPIIFLSGALAHFEKGNLAYAALQLNQQMGFSAIEYGVGSGLYFLGYGLFILPSTFTTIRYGARRWVGTMTVVTGIIGMCHALISNRPGFYVLRCLLGIAEAGGGSSAGHLLAQFYPKSRLAQPFTIMMLSYFAAGIMAAPLATGLMSMHGLGGLLGWQWLFMVEAIPSLVIGVIIWCWLPSHPLTARMLTPRQRELVFMKVHGSAEAADAARVKPRWSQMLGIVFDTSKRTLLWFFTATSLLHGMSFFSFHPWTTVIINNMLHGTALNHGSSSGFASPHGGGSGGSGGGQLPIKAILLSSVPAISGSVAAVICAWHSDRTNEKHLHVALPWLVSGVLLGLFGPMVSISFIAGFVTLVLAKTLSAASSGVMSSLLVACLDTKHAGIGLAMHHAVVACVAGFAGPVFVGALVQRTGSFGAAMALNGSLQVISSLLMVGLAFWTRGWWCMRRGKKDDDTAFSASASCLDPSSPFEQRSKEPLPLVGGALLAAGIPEEEPPGTVPDLAIELSQASTIALPPAISAHLHKRRSVDV